MKLFSSLRVKSSFCFWPCYTGSTTFGTSEFVPVAGYSSPGPSAPGSSKSGPFSSGPSNFGSFIFDIDIEDVLNKFSQCHHRLQIANIFNNNFHHLNLFIFSLMRLLFLKVFYIKTLIFYSYCKNTLICLQHFYKQSKHKENIETCYFIVIKCK